MFGQEFCEMFAFQSHYAFRCICWPFERGYIVHVNWGMSQLASYSTSGVEIHQNRLRNYWASEDETVHYVPNNEDTKDCSNSSDPISNMAGVWPF